MKKENSRIRLRKLLSRKEILVVPGVHDGLTARIVEIEGFNALYMTGYGTSASMLGKPDVGLLTLTEMAARASRLVDAVDIPVIADADTGYGNAVNVTRTVREYEKAGVACLQLEDQVAPKKCGHMLGREIISIEEMTGKIKAACDARQDDELLIMARTDARTSFGIKEAIERGKAYEEAGADIIFIESPETEEEMKQITSSFSVPVLANMVEHGRTPFLPVSALEEIGYDLVIFPVTSTYVIAKAVSEVMKVLKETGSTGNIVDKMIAFEEFNKLIGLPAICEIEKRYSTEGK
ncbi:MAG: oxaloacetate decarboxylase [Aminobacterium colombiense]|uniref:2-methylisocitrate lyase n=1 Tax=Aminobacterium colombiense (strain DSM 12261 / ALA-1) TaxID=572547 RepID=D5EFV4_AMICL|nr:oxaloacetate decarboxylase [Aminobacterium sp. EBM-42]ADE57436.1 carboxyvinyl-carboxyphosphonatephosphorylmutase [Aminobacterium colombiense DSM 12261]MDD2379348.1 oxaloacetate decarboxylase [Aminobacterium colombiense]MDD4266071.1 oxaloacetate decarboxylase [Aminobacterium colombiense]MDD4585584.1 oxaloacetate decarboxylase [Aminobacterium colombiense]